MPAFAFSLHQEVDRYTVFDLSAALRESGWLLPAYTFPADRMDLSVLRVVVRNGFTHDLDDMLLDDMRRAVARLQRVLDRVRQADHSADGVSQDANAR
ncbi:MAG TPA: hypothetical protein VGQ92_21230 [Actinoplanes sp.]|nr:hypothetical protein [Actinoplanes sp.]